MKRRVQADTFPSARLGRGLGRGQALPQNLRSPRPLPLAQGTLSAPFDASRSARASVSGAERPLSNAEGPGVRSPRYGVAAAPVSGRRSAGVASPVASRARAGRGSDWRQR
jgi:hypothetical protein